MSRLLELLRDLRDLPISRTAAWKKIRRECAKEVMPHPLRTSTIRRNLSLPASEPRAGEPSLLGAVTGDDLAGNSSKLAVATAPEAD